MHPRELDLSYNPFEEENDDERTPQIRQYFGSAFVSNVQTPTPRRRSFGSSDRPTGSAGTVRKRHTRSRTEVNVEIPDPEIGAHPLKSAALRSAAFQDFDITRPNLSRIVQSSGVLVRASSYGPEDSGNRSPSPKEEEKDVLIHEITSKDSLAGVSLKYGIPLPELRRANQLWTSDSIHLRKILYIPIDRAKRAHEYLTEAQDITSMPSAQENATDSPPPGNGSLTFSPTLALSSPAGSTSDATTPEIRKIPASQLSFFPPSTQPSRTTTPSGTPSPSTTEFTGAGQRAPYLKSSNPATRTGASPAHSLTSLLTALPIAASTRDEIVSRLSFDSVSSSYSDKPRSRAGSDEERGHEMNDVTKGRHDLEPESPSTQTLRPYFSDGIPLSSNLKANGSSNPRPHRSHDARPLLSTSPPSSYVAQQIQNPYVRTQQLEPSPGMQLPSKGAHVLGRSHSLGRASSKDYPKQSLYQTSFLDARGKPTPKSRDVFDHDIELERST
ncbi:hypothetical protein D9611_000390 [Ephemerocybe angulata]|uniref:LysM domain-containing protein n=1 Tax=Ephemerocybe angulata TaxID=980116 RepID=A0A8H5BM94_9AGAR|nr:hypothetical protein D9611_000390 [Tulosesus angulatus]